MLKGHCRLIIKPEPLDLPLGNDGKENESVVAARVAADKQVAEKIRRGYRENRGRPSTVKNNMEWVVRPRSRLLGQDDADAVRQGITLLRALDNPSP
jgi:hypothetical protein